MAKRFLNLTRPNIRALRPGQMITEHGITTARLSDNDIRYSVNIMVDGCRIHRVIGRESEGTTRTQAEQFIEKARTEARENRLSLPQGRKLSLSFEAAAKLYLKMLKETGGKDIAKNEQHLAQHLIPYFRNMRLERISTFTVEKFQQDRRKAGLNETTINRILATYRRMGRSLVRWKSISSPFPMVKLSKEENHRDYILSQEDEIKLLESALQDSNAFIWLFIKIGLATGLRHREILNARFEHFDSNRRRIKVSVKGGRWRDQPLTRGITAILLRERRMSRDPKGWIFPSLRTPSKPMDSMNKPFTRCVKRAGLNPKIVIPHSMRHTAITRLASTGADVKTIQEFSGHKSLAMVMRYAHPQDHVINRALDKMENRTIIEHLATVNAGKSD